MFFFEALLVLLSSLPIVVHLAAPLQKLVDDFLKRFSDKKKPKKREVGGNFA